MPQNSYGALLPSCPFLCLQWKERINCLVSGARFSPWCNTLFLPFSFHICQFSLLFWALYSTSTVCPSLIHFSNIHSPFAARLRHTCHVCPPSMCGPFICLSSLLFFSLISPAVVMVQTSYKQHFDKERPPNNITLNVLLLFLRHQLEICLNWQGVV